MHFAFILFVVFGGLLIFLWEMDVMVAHSCGFLSSTYWIFSYKRPLLFCQGWYWFSAISDYSAKMPGLAFWL